MNGNANNKTTFFDPIIEVTQPKKSDPTSPPTLFQRLKKKNFYKMTSTAIPFIFICLTYLSIPPMILVNWLMQMTEEFYLKIIFAKLEQSTQMHILARAQVNSLNEEEKMYKSVGFDKRFFSTCNCN